MPHIFQLQVLYLSRFILPGNMSLPKSKTSEGKVSQKVGDEARPVKNVFSLQAGQKVPSSRADFPPVWDGFPYVFLYFALQITKFPYNKELPILHVFITKCLLVCFQLAKLITVKAVKEILHLCKMSVNV